MDGMGSTRRDMELPGAGYVSEFDLPRAPGFTEAQRAHEPPFGWREAESAYSFRGLRLERLFKRWTPEPTPVFLHNYGFENLESLGAIYSRVASHVFGDWNACGKVMGLAPWAARWARGRKRRAVLRGPLERLRVDWERLRTEPHPNAWAEESHRGGYARLAADAQADLEDVVLEFLRRLRRQTGARNLALCGGVALNCVLNGRVARECGFEQVFVPPYPGDEGIAVGGAAYAWHARNPRATAPRRPLRPFGGRAYATDETEHALTDFGPWLEELAPARDEEALLERIAAEIARGRAVGWFFGRGEFGPRALGRRSILADPRRAAMVERLNRAVKKREAFRPFAPAVLAEHAAAWFLAPPVSPYMSFTAPATARARREVPAIVHTDGSARLQTLPAEDSPAHPAGCPRLRRLVERFHARTGVPMLLNTSFNLRGEPVVETPRDAIWTFLRTDLDLLVLDGRMFRARSFARAARGARPLAPTSLALESVVGADGAPLSLRALCWGEMHDLEPEDAELLRAANGRRPLAPRQRATARRLWSLRLLCFTSAAKARRGRTTR
jgi:carbamoyltransferase